MGSPGLAEARRWLAQILAARRRLDIKNVNHEGMQDSPSTLVRGVSVDPSGQPSCTEVLGFLQKALGRDASKFL